MSEKFSEGIEKFEIKDGQLLLKLGVVSSISLEYDDWFELKKV